MDFYRDRTQFRTIKVFLKLTGQWPYDESRSKALRRGIITFMLSTFLLAEVSTIYTAKGDIDSILDTFPYVVFTLILLVKYYTCWIKEDVIKRILHRIENDWSILEPNEELDIMQKYAEESWLYSKAYMLFVIAGTVGIVVLVSSFPILDIIAPLNDSSPRVVLIQFEYFVDMKKYRIPIFLHEVLSYGIGMVCMVGADILLILMVYHACGMFGVFG
ncbi:hypothetical protein KM043_007893 [Ampulex compressa]|nr:hypothetical protein KM043_007893 [Ampulex compressa]